MSFACRSGVHRTDVTKSNLTVTHWNRIAALHTNALHHPFTQKSKSSNLCLSCSLLEFLKKILSTQILPTKGLDKQDALIGHESLHLRKRKPFILESRRILNASFSRDGCEECTSRPSPTTTTSLRTRRRLTNET